MSALPERPSAYAALLGVRDDERGPLMLAFAYFFCVLASYYVLRPIRDEMGVAGGVDNLPWLFLGTLVATLVVSPLFSTLVARLPRPRFIAWSYRAMSACLVGFLLALSLLPEATHVWIGRVFFIWLSVYSLFVVSLFWAVMADVFRSQSARRLFGVISAGGTLGGLTGGMITALAVEHLGTLPLLLVSVLLLEGALWCMRQLSRHTAASDEEAAQLESEVIGGQWYAGFSAAARSPYLLGVCAYMLLYTVGSTFLYFLQAEIVGQAISDSAERTAYFAQVDMLINALTLVLQLFLTGRALGALGVGMTLSLLPLMSVGGFLTLSLTPVLGAVVVFQVARRVTNFALSNPAREVLFVPLSREDKYKAKNLIDTFVYRLGDQVGAWTHAGLAAIGIGSAGIAAAGIPVSLAWVALAAWLGVRHRRLVVRDEPPEPPPLVPFPPRRPLIPSSDSPPLH